MYAIGRTASQPLEMRVTFKTVLGFVLGLGMIAGGILLASSDSGGITISWETASEVDTMGFNLLRAEGSTQAPFQQINSEIILATGDPLTGSEYQVEDGDVEPGRLYFYQIEEIEWNGARTPYPETVRARAGLPRMWLIAEGILLILVGGALIYLLARHLRHPNRALARSDGT